jgi:hypothetical protein
MSKDGFVNIHGKEYKTVAKRVQEFRESVVYKGWSIMTEIVKIDDDQCVMKASVISLESKIIATGHGCEFKASSQINKTSYVENCETSAIGRALACLGLGGTEFASANEVANAIHQQTTQRATPKSTVIKATDGAGENLSADVKQYIQEQADEIAADIDMNNVEAAYERLTEASKDDSGEINNEYKVYAWSLLKSQVRTAITKHLNSLKESK